jgi:hypothetical protein
MPWVRIDEVFPRHPKVVQVGPLGIALQVAALCYCNHYLTDGFISFAAVRTLLDFDGIGEDHGERVEFWSPVAGLQIADRLVEAGMWQQVPGGFRIHDYAKYQPTKAQVEAERERNKRAGQKGGLARAKRGASEPSSGGSSSRQAETQAKSKPVPVPGNSSSPKAAAAVTRAEERAAAASPSQVASGDRSAAEPSNPSLAATNGRPCRHHNDPATCAICSDAPGSPPPRKALDQALGRVRDAAALSQHDPEATP